MIYQATIVPTQNPENTETYVGLCEPTFKERISNHKKDFKHQKYENSTELSKHIWKLKNQNTDYSISWKILDRAQPFSPVSGLCNLCTSEKYFIIFEPEKASINQLDELYGPCLHKHKKLLAKS